MKNRIDDIEVLRALAVMLVVLEHLQLNLITWRTPEVISFFSYLGGWAGVDLFFAISGFVIARDLVPRLQGASDRSDYLNKTVVFWLRRFWRIIPSAWLWLALIMLGVLFLNESGAWGGFRSNFETIISALLQVANLHMAHVYGEGFAGAAFPYWSLSLEEQFYLLLPFIVLLSGRWLPHVLGVIVIIQLAMVRDSLYLNLMRTDALFLGVLIALWSKRETYRIFEPVFMQSRPYLRMLILIVLVGAIATAGSLHLRVIEHRLSLIAVISAVLVLIASYDKNYISSLGWLKKPLLWIGTRSYAIYLIHLPAYYLTREFWYRMEPAGTVFDASFTFKYLGVAFFLLFVLSDLNYRLIETPFRKRGVEIANKVAARQLEKSGTN